MPYVLLLLVALVAPSRAADASAGKLVYTANCTACHGVAGDGRGPAAVALRPPPTDFTAPGWGASRTDDALGAAIRNGTPGTSMTPFTRLTDTQLADLVAYVRVLSGAP
jgi:high-affinity iron transporter